MKKGLYIGIGKFGKSVLFDKTKWGPIGGDNEMPSLYSKMFHLNPDITFVIIGKSDFSRLKGGLREELNKYGNVIDIWENFDKKKHDGLTWIYDELKNRKIKLDSCVLYNGICGTVNIPNKIFLRRDPTKIGLVLETFQNYTAPIIWYLNESKVKYISIAPDPRYHPLRAGDLINQPVRTLSQYNADEEKQHIKSYEDQSYVTTIIPTRYDATETVCLMDMKKVDVQTYEKKRKMMIVLNEGGNGGLKRGPMLKEYILQNEYFNDVEIYGKWDEPYASDPHFKGSRKFEELVPMLKETKYTFIIPIQKGWSTGKFWEMINYGIIPFMHPYYDSQNNIQCSKIFRISSPQELVQRIEAFEKNEQLYIETLKHMNALLKQEYYDGTYMNNLILSELGRII